MRTNQERQDELIKSVAAANQQASIENARRLLPVLEGSFRQISWAENIRATWARYADKQLAGFKTFWKPADYDRLVAKVEDRLNNTVKAADWIALRDCVSWDIYWLNNGGRD